MPAGIWDYWPLYGYISGQTLFASDSGFKDDAIFGHREFFGGYLTGSITGTFIVAAMKTRFKHKRLWEESLVMKNPEPPMNIQLLPLDPNSISIHYRTLPNGKTYYEYQIDLVRVQF